MREGQLNNVPLFKQIAVAYRFADTNYSVLAAFLDYNNDGDLDKYLATNKLAKRTFTSLSIRDTSIKDYNRLYRNDWNTQLQHPIFTDVSKAAGIHQHVYGLGFVIVDINKTD